MAGLALELALQKVPRLPEAELRQHAEYLRKESYVDILCLQEARRHPEEWNSFELPLRVKHALGRIVDEMSCEAALPAQAIARHRSPSMQLGADSAAPVGSRVALAAQSTHCTAQHRSPEMQLCTDSVAACAGSQLAVELGSLGALPPVALAACCWFLDPISVGTLSATAARWREVANGPEFAGLWSHFAHRTDKALLSNLEGPMQRFMQLANLDVGGVWLDAGSDDKEEYKFLTSMREVKRRGHIRRTMEAISYFSDTEAKVTYARLDGAIYLGFERFKNMSTGALTSPINMASGVLDLRHPTQPRIFGTWVQYDPTIERSRRRSLSLRTRTWGLARPRATGEFEFAFIDSTYDEQAGKRRRLREKAGLCPTGDLYEARPLDQFKI